MSYVIHYFAGTVYDGADFRETKHEYYALKELRKDEGWQRIGSYTENGDTVLIMHMADRRKEVRR